MSRSLVTYVVKSFDLSFLGTVGASWEDPDAKLTPAEREQAPSIHLQIPISRCIAEAARIREFQRRCQESGPSPMQEHGESCGSVKSYHVTKMFG